MCGFVGILNNKKISDETLIRARDETIHRGPDDAGLYISKDRHVGLAFRRLSIIDLSPTGHQPMTNEDKTIWIVFNGEVYNFIELRKELEHLGHRFVSNTDTETILHGYEEWGTDVVEHLRGMFAFGIWDDKKNCAFLAVDPIGIKPLYYCEKNGMFAFSSELKSLLQFPEISREIDVQALNQYFAFGYIPSEYSIYRDIKKLPPGHFIVYSNGTETKKKYYRLMFPTLECLKNEEDLIEQLHYLIKDSVRLAMRSDVPVGVFLSGGIDSSIIATIAASYSSHPLQTFSIGFQESKYNELPYAKRIADHISSDHHEFYVTIDSLDALNNISHQFDEPFADSSAIPTFYVAKMAREYVKVALSGDGGDELFGGYNWYMWVKNAQLAKKIMGPFGTILSILAGNIPEGVKGKNFLSTIKNDASTQFIERTFIFRSNERARIINEELRDGIQLMLPEEKIAEAFYFHSKDITLQMQSIDFTFYLPYDGLVKVDRASMLSSVEVRPPYLDRDIVKFVFSLPEKYKIRGFTKKYLLKKLAARILPSDFPLERKQGFCIPLREWLNGKVGNILEESISESKVQDFINYDYLSELIIAHKKGKVDQSSRLWSILMFLLWARNYL